MTAEQPSTTLLCSVVASVMSAATISSSAPCPCFNFPCNGARMTSSISIHLLASEERIKIAAQVSCLLYLVIAINSTNLMLIKSSGRYLAALSQQRCDHVYQHCSCFARISDQGSDFLAPCKKLANHSASDSPCSSSHQDPATSWTLKSILAVLLRENLSQTI